MDINADTYASISGNVNFEAIERYLKINYGYKILFEEIYRVMTNDFLIST